MCGAPDNRAAQMSLTLTLSRHTGEGIQHVRNAAAFEYRHKVVAHLEITDRPGPPASAEAACESADDAVISAAGVLVLDGRIVVRVTGDDRASFFHGMCTADVTGARPGSILPAMFLTEHAHVIADAFIGVPGDALVLDIDSDAWTRTRTHLERLLVADDVEFEELGE